MLMLTAFLLSAIAVDVVTHLLGVNSCDNVSLSGTICSGMSGFVQQVLLECSVNGRSCKSAA